MACPGKWQHGPKPAVPWWLTWTQVPHLTLGLDLGSNRCSRRLEMCGSPILELVPLFWGWFQGNPEGQKSTFTGPPGFPPDTGPNRFLARVEAETGGSKPKKDVPHVEGSEWTVDQGGLVLGVRHGGHKGKGLAPEELLLHS